MRYYLLILFFFASLVSCRHHRELSESEFTSIYRDSLAHRFPGVKFSIVKTMEIKADSNGHSYSVYLNNVYDLYKASPDSLSPVIIHHIMSYGDAMRLQHPVQKDNIVPIIKDTAYLGDLEMTTKFKRSDLMYEKYNAKLLILYAENNEHSFAYLTKKRLEEAHISDDSLPSVSRRNLVAALPGLERRGGDGLYMFNAGGDFETSLILLDYVWSKENCPVDGMPVVAIPARGLIFVTGSKNKKGIAKIRQLASDAASTGAYRLIPDLFIRIGNKFEPYDDE